MFTDFFLIPAQMADTDDSQSHSVSSGSESEHDQLDSIANENALYSKLKSNRMEYGFENCHSSKSNEGGHNKLTLRLKRKRISDNGSNTKENRGKKSKNGTTSHGQSSTSTSNGIGNAHPTTSTNSNFNTNEEPAKMWKHKKNSKTSFLKEYFEIVIDSDGNSGAHCKICQHIASVSQGNNSNMVSHLRYVSALSCLFDVSKCIFIII